MKLVIFDCDGVLVDSELIACSAEADALSAIGYEITPESVVERFTGLPSEEMYARIEAELGRALPGDFGAQVKQRIMAEYRTKLTAIDGAAEVLSSLPVMKCVASSSSPAKLALGLVETGLYEFLYPHVYSTALVERGKPHPDLFLYAADAMGVRAADCIVVEDSIAGVTAGRAAGMKVIGFTGGSHCAPGHAEKLFQAGADTVINDLRLVLRDALIG